MTRYEKETVVLNLWGGAGIGKTTMAAFLFAQLSARGIPVALIQEYVKDWAIRGQEIGRWDEPYIFMKQVRKESGWYGKVDYIVTDRPLGLSLVYEKFFGKDRMLSGIVNSLLEAQQREGLKHIDFMVKRRHKYVEQGRYQTEAEALRVDEICREIRPNMPVVATSRDVLRYLGLERKQKGKS